MENDIDVEQLARTNTLREEKLRKFKQNIEAMQNNLRTKPTPTPTPITPAITTANPNTFGYNSSLFRQLANDSQPIDNGSAVSNFSVHNIQQLLNARSMSPPPSPLGSGAGTPTNDPHDPFLASIESVLKKVKLSTNNSKLGHEKYEEGRESMVRQDNMAPIEPPRKALHQFKLMLAEEQRQSTERNKGRQKPDYEERPIRNERERARQDHGHRQVVSDLSEKSEWTQTPRLPPNPRKTAVDRHKQLIRQEFKKLENARQDYDHEVDFQLSDDEDEEQHHQRNTTASKDSKDKRDKRERLLGERAALVEELREVEGELGQLEREQGW